MLFFYEMLFVAVAVLAIGIGEWWSRTAALLFLAAWWLVVMIGYASFGARLAQSEGLDEEQRRWFENAQDGLRHLRLLFTLAVAAALLWRILAG